MRYCFRDLCCSWILTTFTWYLQWKVYCMICCLFRLGNGSLTLNNINVICAVKQFFLLQMLFGMRYCFRDLCRSWLLTFTRYLQLIALYVCFRWDIALYFCLCNCYNVLLGLFWKNNDDKFTVTEHLKFAFWRQDGWRNTFPLN